MTRNQRGEFVGQELPQVATVGLNGHYSSVQAREGATHEETMEFLRRLEQEGTTSMEEIRSLPGTQTNNDLSVL